MASATVNIVHPDTKVRYVEGNIAVVPSEPVQKREITEDNGMRVYKLIADAYLSNPIK